MSQESVVFPGDTEYLGLLDCAYILSPSVDGNECPEAEGNMQALSKVVKPVESLGNYKTCNPSFYLELQLGQQMLAEYFDPNRPQKRPLNCLLLGPPGSGKTFLAKRLGGTLKNSMFLDYNLAQLDHPGRVAEIFREIGQIGQRTEAPKIVFLDEFDVKIGGTSMIRYLIHSMYEGKFGDGQELKKTAFIFSGSYLKNKQILSVLQRNASDFDFVHFLYDTYLHLADRPEARQSIQNLFDLSLKYREARNQMSPDRDTVDYLRRLDKLPDFLSRINGFVIEIPDVSAPLEVTEPPFWISMSEQGGRQKTLRIKRRQNTSAAQDVLSFVLARERLEMNRIERSSPQPDQFRYPAGAHFIHKYDLSELHAILAFKNMLLCERLSRVVMMIQERFSVYDCRVLSISRRLLNYLAVAPLIHGMRSLEYIIGKLTITPDPNGKSMIRFVESELGDDIDRMHVRKEGEYRDEDSVWLAMRKANPDAFMLHKHGEMHSEIINIVLPKNKSVI